jgi:glycosyltransferase involved in cell wall biosynthesis
MFAGMNGQLLKRVVFDCERMKYPYTGLYHFCLHLGEALSAIAPAHQKEMLFYTNKATPHVFGEGKKYIRQLSHHKFFNHPYSVGDVWHATYQGSMYLPGTSKVKKVLTVHDLNFIYEHAGDKHIRKRYLGRIQKRIDQSDAVVAISEFTKNDFLQHVDMRGRNITVIYNGCNIPSHITPQKPSFLKEGEPFLFSVGTVVPKKNFHTLPCLLAGNQYKMVIAGIHSDPQYPQQIWEQAHAWKVTDRMLLPGTITEAEKWWLLQHCEAFLFPSLAEGFGLPVIEAMYFGKPVFLSSLSSLPEIGGDCAYYFNSFEAGEMQQTFADGLINYKTYSHMAEHIRQRAYSFSWEEAAKRYMQVYDSLL